MKKHGIFLLMIMVLMCLLMAACQDASEDALPKGLYTSVEGIPSIDTFSGTAYEACAERFPAIESVALYRNGIAEPLSVIDERVIRLLNFIGNSFEERNYTYTTGLVTADEIERRYESDAMPEVVFHATEVGDYQKLLVSGSSCLKVLDPEGYAWADGPVAEENRLYMQLIDPTGGTKTQWIDLLKYSGLTDDD